MEALRKRVPSLDGWRVLVVAGGVALALAALFAPLSTVADALAAGRVAVVAWLLAVGGDAWVSKLVGVTARKPPLVVSADPAGDPTHVTITRGQP